MDTQKNTNPTAVRNLTYMAMFTALIAASGQITVPLPSGVPVTLQTLAVALCGYCLGLRGGLFSTAAFLLLGMVGAPVFSGFGAGIPVLFGKTGGFLIGFIFLILGCGGAAEAKKLPARLAGGIIGLVLCHLVGTLWFAYLTQMPLPAAAALVSLPFAVKDIVCVAGAALLAGRLRRLIRFRQDGKE